MARRLANLVDSENELRPNDSIHFTFKSHRFSATVTVSGLIHDVRWTTPEGNDFSVFPTRTFESLTDFTETCIQEKLDEYHTRYSAWRRVRHTRTGKPMEQIYKSYSANKLTKNISKLSSAEYQQLVTLKEQSILALQNENKRLKEDQEKWSKWFETEHPGKNSPVRVVPQKKKPVVQPILLDSPSGTYLVIQRMKEKSPEAEKAIKSLGIGGFRKMTEKFQKENITWNPPSNPEGWWSKSVDQINKDPRLVAKFVHEFFKK